MAQEREIGEGVIDGVQKSVAQLGLRAVPHFPKPLCASDTDRLIHDQFYKRFHLKCPQYLNGVNAWRERF